ncbi:MAG: tetratricopeptide repeat protein [Bacteroidetes bacterium]|nr:tetratricopeptide repeat protein [Bacteroidota bacterium]
MKQLALKRFFWSTALSFSLVACGVEQTSITSNIFHNVTAHFNGYFYAKEGAREVEELILKSLDDDHNKILLLYPRLDTVLAKSYKKNTDEIIKMASISIQRHPNSLWVDDNYVMVGLARLYACDYQNAILTFKYVNTKSRDVRLRHIALINLVRTFTEMGDYDRAEEAIRFLEKEKLGKRNMKKFLLEKANYYQVRNDYNNMVNNLSKADTLLTRHDRRGRIYFIVGQVYQKLGFNAEAYNFYKKCLATNPDYEIDFYARLNMAQVAKLGSMRDIRLIRKQFDKLLKDTKNAEFKDKIYFELGEFEHKQGNLDNALKDYKLAAHAGKNKRTQGMAYLRVGQINFDSLKKYKPAKLYYDSAVASLPKDYEDLEKIKKRQNVLGEFVKYTETITLNDSLLYLSTLDTATIRHRFDSLAATQKKVVSKKKRKRSLVANNNDSSPQNNLPSGNPTSDAETGDWYFASRDLMATGQTEFERVWGDVKLEDNWRRSSRSNSTLSDASSAQPTEEAKTKSDAQPRPTEKKEDLVAKLIAQLPDTEEKKNEALAKIEDAYFHLGDLYYFNLNEKDNAAESYEKLLARFPKSEKRPEVLYKLYLIHKEKNDGQAEKYAQLLQDEYPTSTFARLLVNPDYIKETTALAEKQKLMYKEAYTLYQQNNLRPAMEKVNEALTAGETNFTPQLTLLKILITGRTEDVSQYQYDLNEFIQKYPKHPLKAYAEQLVASSKTFVEKVEKAKENKFGSTSGTHFFVVVYNSADRITNPVVDALEKFNATSWKGLKLTTSNLGFEDKTMTMCVEIPDREKAMAYYYQFLSDLSKNKPFSDYKIYNFVITKDNFQILYRTKSLDEYLTFFDKNYQK